MLTCLFVFFSICWQIIKELFAAAKLLPMIKFSHQYTLLGLNNVIFCLIFLSVTLDIMQQNYKDATINPGNYLLGEIESSLDSNEIVFYSLSRYIRQWNTSQGRETATAIIDNKVFIASFHQISNRKFLVSDKGSVKIYQLPDSVNNITTKDTLVCKQPDCCQQSNFNCRQNASLNLGPIAVDHSSSSEVIFYIDGSTLYKVNLTANGSTTTFNFGSNGENATALTFNADFSTAFIFLQRGNTITAKRFNLQSKKSHLLSLHGYSNPVGKAISIDKGVLLCLTTEDELMLVNVNAELYGYVYEGMTCLPYDTTDIGHKQLKLRDIADIHNSRSLLALDLDGKLIKYNYDGMLSPFIIFTYCKV